LSQHTVILSEAYFSAAEGPAFRATESRTDRCIHRTSTPQKNVIQFTLHSRNRMTPPLRPMNLGEILDRTFQIYRSRFLAFTGIAAIPVLAMEFVEVIDRTWLHAHSLFQPSGQPETLMWNFVIGLGFYHLLCLFGGLVEPASVKLATGLILGEKCSTVSSLRFASARWRSYLWIAFLKMSIVLVLPELVLVALGICAVFLADAGGLLSQEMKWTLPLLSALVILVAFALFLWLGACLSLAIPAAALEDLSGFRSLRRSWALTKGTRARIWFTWLAIFVTSWVLAWGLEFLLGQFMHFAGGVLHLANAMRHLYARTVFVLITAFDALVGPIGPIALTLFYYDQRIRREGYDIEQMMAAAGLNPTALPTADAPATPAFPHEGHA
jgi:Membrane domain of glycerophosphoryl diester phosphodiesterase